MIKTKSLKKAEVPTNWYLVDAKGKRLGRLATTCAELLMGKNTAMHEKHLLPMEKVIIINAADVDVHKRKLTQKMYPRHSGYPGGYKEVSLQVMLEKKPEHVIEHAIKGMLPKNKLADEMMGNLYVYKNAEHPHVAQQPKIITV